MLSAICGHCKSGSWRTLCTLSPRIGLPDDWARAEDVIEHILVVNSCYFFYVHADVDNTWGCQ